MSEILKTEAIVLKLMDYRETSKIVTFYTRQIGKLSGIVKGARRSKNKFGASLEPMSEVSLVVYNNERREIQTVSQCDLLESFCRISEDLEKMAVGLAMIELVNTVAHEQEQNTSLYDLLLVSLSVLNRATKNFLNLLYRFEIGLAFALGFGFSFTSCMSCGRTIITADNDSEMIEFQLDKGGPLCLKCGGMAGRKVKLSRNVLRMLEFISSEKDMGEVLEPTIAKKDQESIQNFLWAYLQFHVSGLRPLKSKRVFSTLFVTS